MDPSTHLQLSKTRTKVNLASKSIQGNNTSTKESIQPSDSNINTSIITQKQEKSGSSRLTRHQNWRLSDKSFNLISTIIHGPLVVSPWERCYSPERTPDPTQPPSSLVNSTTPKIVATKINLTSKNLEIKNLITTQSTKSTTRTQSIDAIAAPKSCFNSQEITNALPLPAAPSRLRKVTELTPPMLPEVPTLKKSTSSTQALMSSFFPTVKSSSQRERISEHTKLIQEKQASLSYDTDTQTRSTQVTLLNTDPGSISEINNPRSEQAQNSLSEKGSKRQTITKIFNDDRNNKIDTAAAAVDEFQHGCFMKYSSQSPSIVSLKETDTRFTSTPNASLGSNADVIEFIPSTPELQMWIPDTHIGEVGHDSREISGNPINSPLAFSSLDQSYQSYQLRKGVVYDSSSSLSTSQAGSPNKRNAGSESFSKEPKKDSKRKKRDRNPSSVDTIPDSPVGSLISSTALFEARIAEIERYVDQDLYGYNNLSY